MRMIGMAVAATMVIFAAGEVQALPIAPPLQTSDSGLIQVRDGCGFGAHQGRFGGCRLNRGPRGQMRRFFGGAPRGCPPGTHPTGRGFCRRYGY